MVVADADPDVVPLMLFSVVLAGFEAGLVALMLPVVLTDAMLAVVLAGSEAGPVALMLPVVLAERVSAVGRVP